MSKQTINIGASPNDGTGTPLRTSFDYTNQNFTELYTALGGGVGLPGATTQVIFNDGGTNLAGDAGLVYNKTTDALTVAGLVTAGSATITGDLTVRTNKLAVTSTGVGCGTATPANQLSVRNEGASGVSVIDVRGGTGGAGVLQISGNGTTLGTTSFDFIQNGAGAFILNRDATPLAFSVNGAERYNIGTTGISTWSVAGTTAMTLNSTGLGIGASPRAKLDVNGGLLVNNYTTSTNYAPLSVTTVSAITTPSTFTNAINIWNPTTVGAYSNITFGYNALGITNAPAYIGFVSTNSGAGGFGDLVFGTRSVGTDTAATERVRIDASGLLFVGATGITAGYTKNSGNNFLIVGGVASPTIKLQSTTGTNAWDIYTANGADLFVAKNGSDLGSFNSTTGVYTPLSDVAKKRDFEPSNIGLAEVLQLQPKLFRMVDDADNAPKTLGFVAQDVKNIIPQAYVEQSGQNGKFIGLHDRPIIAALTRAIQELTARVQTLEAR